MSSTAGSSTPTPYITVGGTSLALPNYARPDLAYTVTLPMPDPAPGTAFFYTTAGFFLEILLSAYVTFNTSAAVAARGLFLAVKQKIGGLNPWAIPSSQTTPATSQVQQGWNVNTSTAYFTSVIGVAPLPVLAVTAGDQFVVNAQNIDAGDQISQVIMTIMRIPTGPKIQAATVEPVATPVLA